MSRLRVALIGYGFAGSVFHAPLIRVVPELEITTVVTSRAGDVARDLPAARVVATPDAVFADPAIDLVVIVTPNPSHFDLARRALLAGKHVVIDKPMTTTSADADALIALARDRERCLSVYQNRRWDGDFRTVAQLIGAGRIGRVYEYEAHFDRFRPALKPGWREVPSLGSGVLFDLGAHLIDQALVLFGMPETLVADVIAQRSEARVDDYFSVTLHHAGNRRAIVRASTLVAEPGPHFVVHGDAGSFVKYGMDPQEAALKAGARVDAPGWGSDAPDAYGTLVRADGGRERIPTLPGAYTEFYASMAAAILSGAPVPVAATQARDVITIIERARRSALERRTVAVTPG